MNGHGGMEMATKNHGQSILYRSGDTVVSGIKASNYITLLQADPEKLVLSGISTPFTYQ